VLPTSKTLVCVIVYVCFFFVVRKEVKKEETEEKIKSTGKKKEYSETQMEGNSKLRLC